VAPSSGAGGREREGARERGSEGARERGRGSEGEGGRGSEGARERERGSEREVCVTLSLFLSVCLSLSLSLSLFLSLSVSLSLCFSLAHTHTHTIGYKRLSERKGSDRLRRPCEISSSKLGENGATRDDRHCLLPAETRQYTRHNTSLAQKAPSEGRLTRLFAVWSLWTDLLEQSTRYQDHSACKCVAMMRKEANDRSVQDVSAVQDSD
jgi:hypothetical protein